MRACLALAALIVVAILCVGMQASAHDIAQACAAEADARALHGKPQIRFEAHCRAATRRAIEINAQENVEVRPRCGVDTWLGACPICLLFLSAWPPEWHCS